MYVYIYVYIYIYIYIYKAKFTLGRHEVPEKDYTISATLSLSLALHEGGWLKLRPNRFTPGKIDMVLIVLEAGWILGLVCTGAEKIALTWIRSPDRPAYSDSLYRLSHPAPLPSPHKHVCVCVCLYIVNKII